MLGTSNVAVAAASPRTDAVSAPRTRTGVGLLADAATTLALLVVAALVRYPYIYVVPRFRDETFNATVALQVYRGEPKWTDHEPYISSLFNYIVAAGMFIVGPTIYAARLVVTAIGVLTVGATYFLGRELGGPLVGIIAASLLLTNGIHIAPMGHVAFSGSITPFFTTVTFWLLHRSRVRRSPWTFVGACFTLGLSMMTHPTIVAFLPGVAGWYLWRNLGVLRGRWPYLGALAFLIAFSPMITFNILTGGESIRYAIYTATERGDYARGKSTALSPATYIEREKDYWLMLHGTLGGAVDDRDGPAAYLTDPTLVATSVLAIVGSVWAARRRGYALFFWLLGSYTLLFPLFDANHYDVAYDGRYVMPLLPMIYAAIGVLIVDVGAWARSRLGSPTAMTGVTVGLALLVVALVAAPVLSLSRYYARGVRAEPTNASFVRAVDDIKAALRPGDIIILDGNLNDRLVPNASDTDEASSLRVFKYLMEFGQVPYLQVDVDATTLTNLTTERQRSVVILSSGVDSKDTARLNDLIAQYSLQSLDGRPARAPRPADRYAIFQFDPARVNAAGGRP
jgi:4-amino-4-deoxy-L-arabinose transferase-like glycosyltransferase